MKVRHLDCGTMRPRGGTLIDGRPGLLRPGHIVCHVLLIETDDGLLLVDTGLGLEDLTSPPGSLPRPFLGFVRPVLDPSVAAVSQVRALGYAPEDVRHIVLTHLDVDHAGGLRDFPRASVHVHRIEHDAAMVRATAGERARYRPAQWAHEPQWKLLGPDVNRRWFGLPAMGSLPGLPDDVLLVPLTGHTRGHVGVAVPTDSGWLLHAGDAYFHHREMAPEPSAPPLIALFERAAQFHGPTRAATQRVLRALIRDHGDEVTVFSAHDRTELERFAG